MAAPKATAAPRRRCRSGIDEAAVVDVVVGGEVEEAMTAVVEEDHALLAGLLGRERLVDGRPDGVRRLRRREPALDPGEELGRFEHLALRVGHRLHPPGL